MMGEIKNYLNGLIGEILQSMDMSPEQRDRAVSSLSKAFNSLSDEEYLKVMGSAFGGQSDLGAVEDFLDATFELPDLQETSKYIFDEVSKYLSENLPQLKRLEGTEEVPMLDQE
jgi:hypothetical protein